MYVIVRMLEVRGCEESCLGARQVVSSALEMGEMVRRRGRSCLLLFQL